MYEPINTHAYGDGWQGEDLSIFSYDDIPANQDILADDPPNLHSLITVGARGIPAWCRPYPAEVVGQVISFDFDMESTEFSLTIDTHCPIEAPRRTDKGMDELSNTDAGMARVYLPYVHYLAPSRSVTEGMRIVGDAEGEGMEWKKGQGPARVGVEVEMSVGKFVVQGQWGTWTYPLDHGEASLKLRKLGS